MRTLAAAVALALVTTAAACDAAPDARSAWLQATLARDNDRFLLREPDLLAGKYRRMAADPDRRTRARPRRGLRRQRAARRRARHRVARRR